MRKISRVIGRNHWVSALLGITESVALATGEGPSTQFSEHLIADHFMYAYGVAAADLDGDGDLDLTAADSRGAPLPNEPDGRGHVYWFENDGRGNFARHVIKTNEGGLFERHAIGDVNGDGHPDVVVVKNRVGHIMWFENSGHPAADKEWQRHVVTTDLMRAYDVALVDIDKDGRLDVAASAYSGNVLAWFRNPGSTGFDRDWAKEVIDPKLGESRTIRLGDFNGDGTPDLLGAGFHEGVTAWYERTGASGSPWKRHVIDDRTPQPTHGCAADMDGDGDTDVVMALGMREVGEKADDRLHQVVWYENVGQPGTGERWEKHVIGNLRHAFEAVAEDLNFDGRMDVVATRWEKEAGEVNWYENLGGGQWRKHVLKDHWNYTNQVIIADLDGDRRPDIVAQSGSVDSEMRLWKNVGAAPPAVVKTGTATPLDAHGATVNGQIQPRGLPARYWFEFGADATYGKVTAPRNLPPRLNAYYRESWDKNRGQWWGGMGGELEHVADPSGGFVRYTEKRLPPGDPGYPYDPNHMDGIGALHLAAIVYPAMMEDPGHRSTFLGGGYPDLRDARVDVKLRGVNFNPKGSELVWWTQSDIDFSKQNAKDWQRANWAYTGFTMTDALASGRWEDVHFQLKNNSHDWTYAGNNLEQKRAGRYAYGSIDDAQRHLNTDFILLLAFVNPDDPPTGAIDLDEFTLTYRNYSLLLPGNGGTLIKAPDDRDQDATKLTDGWRNGKGRMWRSSGKGAGPQEFVYRFATSVTIGRIQLHQHTEWPTKDIEVLTSMDGVTWSPLVQRKLETPSVLGPNFSFLIERDLKRGANFAKVRLVSGYRPEHRGLGEIEFFGEGAVFGTDDDWYNVNLDISGLKPGQTWHYRLVAESAGKKQYGEDQTYTSPADGKPLATTGEARRVSADRAVLTGRLTPMGQRADYYFKYGPTSAYGSKTPVMYGGRQEVPRLVVAALEGLSAGTRYHYKLVATNAEGSVAGADQTFVTRSK